MTEFDDVMALGSGPEGDQTGFLGEGWLIGGAINGGVLMAMGAAAMADEVAAAGGGRDTIAFSAHFLSASQPGPVRLRPEVLRVGRNLATAQVSIVQVGDARAGEPVDTDVERVRMLGTVTDLGGLADPVHRQPAPADLPDPDRCISPNEAPAEFTRHIRILERLDIRLDPATAGFGVGAPSGEGELRGWIRFADGREPDLAALPFFLDAFPPVAFDLGAMGWAPTIEFTGHLRAHPAPGWLRVRLTTSTVSGGLMEEDCVIWDSTGRVVAQSRQLAGVRMPATAGRMPSGASA